MRYIRKENDEKKINLNLDSKQYKLFIDKVSTLGKQLEYKSNKNKLDYSIVINSVRVPYMNCKGWTSRTEDMKHVLFCDFDNILFWIMEEQLKLLIQKCNLPPFYIFKTSEATDCNGEIYGNYLAINLGKHNFMDIVKMQDELACDESHKRLPLIYRFHSWVLRIGPKGNKGKPEFKCIIGNNKREYYQEISSAHLNILNALYKIPDVIIYKNKDRYKKLWSAGYKTAST